MADEAPGGGGESGGAAFNILGRIEVDLAALKKSLGESERMARESAGVHERIWKETRGPKGPRELPGGGFSAGGPGGEGPGGGGGEGGGHSATANFAHMARVVRHSLVPALASINPELAQFVSAGAASARTAVFFGASVGAVAVSTAILSTAISKYVNEAKDLSAATLDASQALSSWDAARAEAGIAQLTSKIAAYNLAVKEAGDSSLGFWQRLVAWASVAAEKITGHLGQMMKKYEEYVIASAEIANKFTIPKAQAEAAAKSADVMGQQAERAKQRAVSEVGLAAAYDKSRQAIADKNAALLRGIDLDEQQKLKQVSPEELRKKILADADERRKVALEELTRPSGMEESPEGRQLIAQRKARVEEEYQEDLEKLKHVDVLSQVESGKIRALKDVERGTQRDAARDKDTAEREKERKDLANLAVERETFAQQEIQQNQKRADVAAATAKAVMDAEQTVAKIRREMAGTVESSADLESRLARERTASLAPLEQALATENALYESKKRALDLAVEAGTAGANAAEKLAALDKAHAEAVLEAEGKIAAAKASTQAKEAQAARERDQAETARENRLMAHAVATGRVSMPEQMEALGRQATDPRRSAAEQEQVEEHLFALKRSYADNYFLYYRSLGDDMWRGQLDSARSLRDENVAGSDKWFAATQKVYDVYKAIYDQAKQIATQTAGIAAGEIERLAQEKEEKKHPKKGPKPPMMSLQDVDWAVQIARQRDEQIYAGGAAKTGDVTAALGRRDLWKEMDRTGMGFKEAFSRMQQTPEQRMMGESGRVFSSAADTFSAAVDRFSGVFGATYGSGVPGATPFPGYQPEDVWGIRGIGSEMTRAQSPESRLAPGAPENAERGEFFEPLHGAVGKTVQTFIDAAGAMGAVVQMLRGGAASARGAGGYSDVLPTNSRGNRGVSSDESSALGRDLYLAGKRGPSTAETYP